MSCFHYLILSDFIWYLSIQVEEESLCDDDSEVPYGIDLSPEALQDMYDKQKNTNEARNVTFSPLVKAISEDEPCTQSEPLSEMKEHTLRKKGKKMITNNKDILNDLSIEKAALNKEEKEKISETKIDVHKQSKDCDVCTEESSPDQDSNTFKESGFDKAKALVEKDINELVGKECEEEFMNSPMPLAKISNLKEQEEIQQDILDSTDNKNDGHIQTLNNQHIEHSESNTCYPNQNKNVSFDTKDRNQISEMLGEQYNPAIVATTEDSNSEWSESMKIKVNPSTDSSHTMDVIPTMSSITDVDFNRTPASKLKENNTEDAIDLYIVCKAPAGPLGLIIGSTARGPIVQLIKASSPLIEQIHIGDVIVRVDEIETQCMSSAALTRIMSAKRNQRERKLLVIRT